MKAIALYAFMRLYQYHGYTVRYARNKKIVYAKKYYQPTRMHISLAWDGEGLIHLVKYQENQALLSGMHSIDSALIRTI